MLFKIYCVICSTTLNVCQNEYYSYILNLNKYMLKFWVYYCRKINKNSCNCFARLFYINFGFKFHKYKFLNTDCFSNKIVCFYLKKRKLKNVLFKYVS